MFLLAAVELSVSQLLKEPPPWIVICTSRWRALTCMSRQGQSSVTYDLGISQVRGEMSHGDLPEQPRYTTIHESWRRCRCRATNRQRGNRLSETPPALSLIASLLASTCAIALEEFSTNRYDCHNKTHNIKHHASLQYCITYTLLGIEIIQDQCSNQVGHLSVIQQTVSTCQQYGHTYPLLWLPKQTPQISISISDPMMSPPTVSFHSRSCIAISKQNQKKKKNLIIIQ